MYRADHHEENEGLCVYLDGLSKHLHGNPETAERDREIRSWLRGNGYDVIEIAVSDLHDQQKMTQHFRRLAGCLRNDTLRAKVRDNTEWFSEGSYEASSVVPFTPRRVQPTPSEMYVTCLPMVPLKAAAGTFGDMQYVNAGEWEWVSVPGGRLRQGMFVAQVVGKSMEPKIPDGAWCLFAPPPSGTRQGKIVVVELADALDPESGEHYTVKRYRSEKIEQAGDSWRHIKITLEPLNREFTPIELTCEHEGEVRVVAEFVEVL
jgi:SOS-response transcriptional repressor LexA